ncbi:hypothetical protein K438DRAFT_1989998 [Mycena galopus ATCC 62051]|nr:hypothetical protein K438DRAFT_1989998 [Mycena galopus ATCC 62051]
MDTSSNDDLNFASVQLFPSAASSAAFHGVSFASGIVSSYNSGPPVPILPHKFSLYDPTNSTDVFFARLHAGKLPNRPSSAMFPSTRRSDSGNESMDDILTPTPPPRHSLFAGPQLPSHPLGASAQHEFSSLLPTFGQFTTSDDFTMSMHPRTPPQKCKERITSAPLDTPSPQGNPPKRRKPSLDTTQKLDAVFSLLSDLDWRLGEFLHHLFSHKDGEGVRISRSQRHGNTVQNFLAGKTMFTVSHIIHAWMTSPDGRGHDEMPLFETERSYLDIGPVRQALAAFAAQNTGDFLGSESRAAVARGSGLYASIGNETHSTSDSDDDADVQWADLSDAIPRAPSHFRRIQQLAYHFLSIVAEPTARSRDGELMLRKSRPRDHVVAHCLSILDFCKSDHARLFPLCRGILYLSSCVPVDIISINSRLGHMPAVNTIKASLKGFSQQKAVVIRTRGRDITVTTHPDGRLTKKAKVLIFDNVQHFRRQRDLRIGRENSMIIGIAGSFFEIEVDAAALDVLDKRKRILTSRRPHITVDDLLNMLDQPHLKQIGILQYLEALTNYIPDAAVYKAEIYSRYRGLAKLQAVVQKMKVHTLAMSGKNEASIAELKDAFLDSLEQMGSTEGDYDSQLWFGGGNGMSFNNMHIVKKYLQNHTDPFQSFELLRPVLKVWHLTWTDLSTSGYSAKKIGHAPPPNLKKVDYYRTAQFIALVHDIRMPDCWSIHFDTNDIFDYFATLKKRNTLPSFEDLHKIALKLFKTYTAPSPRHQVRMDARDEAVAWTPHAPLVTSKTASTKPAISKKNLPPPPPFFGDKTLADDGAFMYDAFINRELVAATAQGNVGRMWEALKATVFTFAGSTHGKYTNYMLEMICDLELESILSVQGKGGDFSACDIFQEWLNRCIDPIVQRKDADYGANHVREIWSRNIKDIYNLKKDYREGVGLVKRSGKHKKPHERPEVKTLLREYRNTELHKRRPGRTFNDGRDVENFQAGVKSFQDGALRKWAKRTASSRIL